MNLLKSNQTITAALVAAVVSVVVTFLFSTKPDETTLSNFESSSHAHISESNRPSEFETQGSSVDRGSKQLSLLKQQMQDVQQKISILQAQQQQLASLEERFGELKGALENTQEGVRLNSLSSSTQAYPLSKNNQIDVQAIEEAGRQDTIALQSNIENRFQAEDIDNAWSQDTESKLSRVLEELNSNQPISVANMECKASTCRFEVVHDEDADLSMFQLMLSTEMSDVLPNAAVIENEMGTTFYLTKDANAFVPGQ